MVLDFFQPRYLWSADSGGGTGAPTDPTPSAPTVPPAAASVDDDDDDSPPPSRQTSALEHDNYRLREQRRQLRARVKELEGRQLPQGGLALTSEQAQQWQSYQQLGATDVIQTALGELQTLRREKIVGDIAVAAGIVGSVLRKIDLLEGGTLVFTTKDLEENGVRQRQVSVQQKDALGAVREIPLLQYVQERHPDLLPALQATGQNQAQSQQQSAQGGAISFIRQNTGGGSGQGSAVDTFLREQEAQRQEALKRNPLVGTR